MESGVRTKRTTVAFIKLYYKIRKIMTGSKLKIIAFKNALTHKILYILITQCQKQINKKTLSNKTKLFITYITLVVS